MSDALRTKDAGARAVPKGGVPWGVAIPVLLIAGVLLAFSPAFGAELLSWDDKTNLIDNTQWQGLGLKNLTWMWTTYHLGHYQPLSWMSFGLQHELGAADASAMHVVNVLLHGVNAVLFFWLCRGLMRAGFGEKADERLVTLGAGLAAGLFALHPLRVESVAWVTERRDVLSTALLLGAGLAYLRSVEVGQVRLKSVRWYAWCVVLVLLSCLSKAWGMSFFVVLLAMDLFPLRRLTLDVRGWFSRDSMRVVLEKAPLVLIGLGTAWLASQAQREASATKTLEQWGVTDRAVQAAYGLWFYVKQSMAPSGLSPLYQLPKRMDPGETQHVVAFVFAVVLIGAVVWFWKKRPAVNLSLLVYVALISPVLGLLQSGEQLVADRYSYLATMPLALLVGAGVVVIARRAAEAGSRLGSLMGVCGVVVLAALGLGTYSQTAVWRDSETLWEHGVKVTPTSMVLGYYGGALQTNGKIEEAQAAYEEALRIDPEDERALFSYAVLLEKQRRMSEAERAYLEAAKHMSQRYQAHQNLGVMYWQQGRQEESLRQFELAIADVERADQKKPSGGPFMTLAIARLEMGDWAGAVAALKKAAGFRDTKKDAEEQLRRMGATP